jgi:hypothetical protein
MLREFITNEWITIILVVCLFLLATAKLLFPSRFSDFLVIPGNSKYLKIYSRDQKFIDLFDGLLYLNFTIGFSLFGFLLYKHLINDLEFELLLFFKLAFGLATILLIKILLERLIGSVFNIDTLVDNYLFQKTSYKNYLGIILLPINTILIYSLLPTKPVFAVIIVLLLLLSFIGFTTSLKTHQKLIISKLFYFILYLCAFEIAPYIILYKVFTTPNAN